MATFNILSSCICRDAFGFQEANPHTICTFLQATSALTWFHYNDKPHRILDTTIFPEGVARSNFQRKCIMNDYNKTVLEQFSEKTDFFITDMTEFASMNLAKEIYGDGSFHYFTYSKWFSKAYTNGLKEILSNKVQQVNQLNLINDTIIEDTISNYVNWILGQGYTEEQIILVENKRCYTYTDGQLLYSFSYKDKLIKINEILDKIYTCFKEKLPNAYVIKMPVGVLADTRHKWGLTDLHFCKEYYDYLYNCFDYITKGKDIVYLNKLHYEYSMFFMEKRELLMKNSFEYVDGIQRIEGDFTFSKCKKYLAPKGTIYYKNQTLTEKVDILNSYHSIAGYDYRMAEFSSNGTTYYISKDDCIKGVIGNQKMISDYWRTIGKNTLAILNDTSIVLGYNGKKILEPAQVIYTVRDIDKIEGKIVTFSVYARVLRLTNKNKGGIIKIINEDGSVNGKTEFINSEWKHLWITIALPEVGKIKKLTLCLGSHAGKGEKADNAIVEFSEPKLEIGTFPTGTEYYPPVIL